MFDNADSPFGKQHSRLKARIGAGTPNPWRSSGTNSPTASRNSRLPSLTTTSRACEWLNTYWGVAPGWYELTPLASPGAFKGKGPNSRAGQSPGKAPLSYQPRTTPWDSCPQKHEGWKPD